MNQSCFSTTLYSGSTFTALHQAACIASYSAPVTVKSSGSSTRKAAVMSASLLIIQPPSTASSGNLLSMVEAFITLRMTHLLPAV